MFESVIMLLIYIALVVGLAYLVLWVLGQLGIELPPRLVQVFWVISRADRHPALVADGRAGDFERTPAVIDAPNQAQIAGQVRTALAAGGPISAVILAKTGWSQGDYELYLEVFLYVVPLLIAAIWSYVAKRPDNLVRAAATVQGATVVVDRTASLAVQDVARKDNTAPDVMTESAFLQKKT